MALLVSVILFIALAATISVYGYYSWVKPAKKMDQIGAAAGAVPAAVTEGAGTSGPNQLTTVLQWIGEKAPKSPQEAKITQRLLFAAGYRSDSAVAVYSGIRLSVMALVGLGAFFLAQAFRLPSILYIVAPIGGVWVGSMIPGLVLDELVKRYRERLRLSLPDALDLLVVCVESGLGLDQAVRMVSDELSITHPEISKELSLVSLEMRTGADRATALRNLADRSGEPELRKFVAVLIQTDRFGTSLAESLRTHSEFMRVRRRNEAEERAGKIGVKLTFPTMLLMMPSIMVVAAGPIVLKIGKELLPAMRNSGH